MYKISPTRIPWQKNRLLYLFLKFQSEGQSKKNYLNDMLQFLYQRLFVAKNIYLLIQSFDHYQAKRVYILIIYYFISK